MSGVGGTGPKEDRGARSVPSAKGLPQQLEAVRKVLRSPNKSSSSSWRGERRDLVSERTPESSLVEHELLSPPSPPLLREWKSAEDSEHGVPSGNDWLLLRLGASTGVVRGVAVTSDPGERVLLARFLFSAGGGGSNLGMI